MFRNNLIEGPSIKTIKTHPPQIDVQEGPNNSVSINFWRSRVLSSQYTGDITEFLTEKIAELFKQDFDKVQIDCGRPSKTICGYHFRPSQGERDADFFSSPKTLHRISSLTDRTINTSQHTKQVKDYDGTGQHIFVTLEAKKR